MKIILKDKSTIDEVIQLLPSAETNSLDWLTPDGDAGTVNLNEIEVILS